MTSDPGLRGASGAEIAHGGNLTAARLLFPGAPEPLIDLSTGINPHAYPIPPLPLEAFTRLPEPAAIAELEAAAAGRYGAPSAAHVVAAPGTQILLPLIASMLPPGEARVLAPTYAEHARAARLAGHDCVEVTDVAGLTGGRLAVLVNPNNPNGRILPREAVLAVRADLLVVDEAFAEAAGDAADGIGLDGAWARSANGPLAPAAPIAPAVVPGVEPELHDLARRSHGKSWLAEPAPAMTAETAWPLGATAALENGSRHPSMFSVVADIRPGLVVLRSFGKFHGLAGVRLGFAVAAPETAAWLRARLGPWAVSGPAVAIGTAALRDRAWAASTRQRLAAEAARLNGLLEASGMAVRGGTSLFRLVQGPVDLFDRLGRAGIIVRRFAERPGYFRLGLPPDDAAWARLAAALPSAGASR